MNESQIFNNPIQQMKQIQKQILENFETLNNLNNKYKTKTQKSFINTFLHIMDRMSNDLIDAQQQYRNIDMEIAADKKCLALAKQLSFFKNECFQLKKQLNQVKLQLNKQRNKNFILAKQSQHLNKALTKKVKEIQKYKTLSYSKQKKNKNQQFQLKTYHAWKSINLDESTARTQRQKLILTHRPEDEGILEQRAELNLFNPFSNRFKFRNREQKIAEQQYRPGTKSFNRDLLTREQASRTSNKFHKVNRPIPIPQVNN